MRGRKAANRDPKGTHGWVTLPLALKQGGTAFLLTWRVEALTGALLSGSGEDFQNPGNERRRTVCRAGAALLVIPEAGRRGGY